MNNKKKLLIIELILLFAGIPVILLVYQSPAIKLVVLILGTIAAIIILYHSGKRRINEYFSFNKNQVVWRTFILKIIIVSSLILILGYLFRRENFFRIPYNPLLIPFLILGYPLISVIPQEIIYRLMYFERYGLLFRNKSVSILINALLFAFMHIIYGNPIAVILTFIGGILFSITYRNTGSLILTAVEHSTYGYFIFLSGYGQYFLSENMFKMLFGS